MAKYILLGFLVALIGGCSVSSTLLTKDFSLNSEDNRMLPVNVIIDADDIPNDQLTNGAYANRTRRHKFILDVLLNEKAFFDISTNDAKFPVTLHIKYHDKWKKDGLATANEFLSAATLFIVPYPITIDVNLDVDVYYGERKIKSFKYFDELDYLVSIINMPVHVEEVYLKKLINNFLVDLSNSNILSPNKKKHNIETIIDAV